MAKSNLKVHFLSSLQKKTKILIFVALFVILGAITLFSTRAATNSISLEAESGTLVGATKVIDSGASGGELIQFATNPTQPGWTLAWSDNFDSQASSVNWVLKTGTEGHSQANYISGNVTYSNGRVNLLTRRHCLSTATEPLTDSNASVAPCAVGKITKYSSGGIDSVNRWDKGKIIIKAKLPVAQQGVWPALWMRNAFGWCTSNYGEIDILEWYFDARSSSTAPLVPSTNETTATSHITCSGNNTIKVGHYEPLASDLTTADHIWEVEWGNSGISYKIDGQLVRTSNRTSPDGNNAKDTAADFGISQAIFDTVLNSQWNIKINTQVIKPVTSGTQWHSAADDNANFNPVTFSIDYVEVYRLN